MHEYCGGFVVAIHTFKEYAREYLGRIEHYISRCHKNNAGMYSASDDSIVGFASKEVDKVKLGIHEAEIITLDEKDMKAWLFHGLKSELLEENDYDLKYFDKEGNVLKTY